MAFHLFIYLNINLPRNQIQYLFRICRMMETEISRERMTERILSKSSGSDTLRTRPSENAHGSAACRHTGDPPDKTAAERAAYKEC